MSYWGNDYMPMVDGLCVDAARSYVKEHGEAIGHAWWECDGRFYADEQAFRYLVCVLDEALAVGIASLMEGDWY